MFYKRILYKTLYCISACKTYHNAYTTVSLRMNSRVSKYIGENRNKKLHIQLENCAFHWFVLYNSITMHGI